MRLLNYLNEARKEAPEIRRLYNKFNRELFNDDLPRDISITWMNSKKNAGSTKAIWDKRKNRVEIKSLSISRNFAMTEDQLKGILVHEMAHIYTSLRINPKEGHGSRFIALINNLQKKVDFNIPENQSMVQRLESTMKPTPTIIGKTKKGEYLIIAIAEKTWKENKNQILKDISRFKFIDETIFYGKITDEIIEEIPKQRKASRIKAHEMSEDEYKKIKSKLQRK